MNFIRKRLGLPWPNYAKFLAHKASLKFRRLSKINTSGITHLLLCKRGIDPSRYVRNRFIPSAGLRRSISVPDARSKAMARLIRPSHYDTS